MPQSFACLHTHIIFSTKNREPLVTKELHPRLGKYIAGILRNIGCRLIAAGGVADHIHLLVSLSKQAAVSDTVRDIKSNSSGWVHKTYPALQSFAWQVGYGAFAVSHSDLEEVKRYIANQVEHHTTMTFKEEFISFLEKHDLEYNEKYLWE